MAAATNHAGLPFIDQGGFKHLDATEQVALSDGVSAALALKFSDFGLDVHKVSNRRLAAKHGMGRAEYPSM